MEWYTFMEKVLDLSTVTARELTEHLVIKHFMHALCNVALAWDVFSSVFFLSKFSSNNRGFFTERFFPMAMWASIA